VSVPQNSRPGLKQPESGHRSSRPDEPSTAKGAGWGVTALPGYQARTNTVASSIAQPIAWSGEMTAFSTIQLPISAEAGYMNSISRRHACSNEPRRLQQFPGNRHARQWPVLVLVCELEPAAQFSRHKHSCFHRITVPCLDQAQGVPSSPIPHEPKSLASQPT
jgi:hypothetical protein